MSYVSLKKAAELILSDRGGAMRSSEIVKEAVKRKLIPRNSSPKSMHSVIITSDSIERAGRGLYRLTQSEPSGNGHATNDSNEPKEYLLGQRSLFSIALNCVAEEIHTCAKEKGWYDSNRGNPEMIALIHSELSESLEALRNGNPASEKIDGFSQAEEELADTVIRLLDMCEANGWDIGGAIMAKVQYNWTRQYRHGGKKH